jgi:hypothetical protein
LRCSKDSSSRRSHKSLAQKVGSISSSAEVPEAYIITECCMSGCAICVSDLYTDALATYQDALGALRASLTSASVPETEWPARVRVPVTAAPPKAENVALSAFEQMELALAAKRAAADASS